MMEQSSAWMSVREIAEEMQISLNRAYTLVSEPDFPKMRIGNLYRIRRRDWEIWTANHIECAGFEPSAQIRRHSPQQSCHFERRHS